MCGIAGFLDHGLSLGKQAAADIVSKMALTLFHRGPDDGGSWIADDGGIALGHRRLSIVELTELGRQPMWSPSRNWVVVFNGEIYNHRDLRSTLESSGFRFRGGSDTEVLVAALDHWGVAESLRRLTGMFAIAAWDRRSRTLILARDRLGEKPLYYHSNSRFTTFASELKAIRAHPHFDAPISLDSLALYLQHNYIPQPRSIHEGVQQVAPGCHIEIRHGSPMAHPRSIPYWSPSLVSAAEGSRGWDRPAGEVVTECSELLAAAIRDQMVADVPVGAFLSGGIDSSTVVALMQQMSSRPVRTFTIGFDDPAYDESPHAQAIAAHLRTDHTCLRVSSRDALDVVPQLATIYDEPFADSSQIPTYLVSRLARQHVTTVLSGDGGDEMLFGYPRYAATMSLWGKISSIPRGLRLMAAGALQSLSIEGINTILDTLRVRRQGSRGSILSGERAHRLAQLLRSSSPADLYFELLRLRTPRPLLASATRLFPFLGTDNSPDPRLDPRDAMMQVDMMTYLPSDILVKVDRAAMACSLETRVPILDHRFVEFARSLPMSLKLRDGRAKWILRAVLERHVPLRLFERPKMGFGIPLADWLRGPLRDWAESLLSPVAAGSSGLFDVREIRSIWQSHLSGRGNYVNQIWGLLMFQAWLESVGSKVR